MGNYLQCVMGIKTEEFVMIAADETTFNSVYVMNTDEDKVHELSDKILLGVIGQEGDTAQLVQFIMSNLQLYKTRNGYELDTAAAAHFTRKTICEAVASNTVYDANMLLGGYSSLEGGQLYYINCLGACQPLRFAAHGFGSPLCMSIFSLFYEPNISESRAYEILEMCVFAVQHRLCSNLPNFMVKVVNKDGIKIMPVISLKTSVLENLEKTKNTAAGTNC